MNRKYFSPVLSLNRFICALFLFFLTNACVEDLYHEKEDQNPSPSNPEKEDFSFSTTHKYKIDINYDSQDTIPFQIYLTNPVSIVNESEVWDESMQPYFADFTDEEGNYSEEYTLPVHTEEVFLCTKKPGYPSCVKLELTENGIHFDLSAPVTNTKAVVTKTLNRPQDLRTLGGWDQLGLPDYLLERASIPSNLLSNLIAYLPESKNIRQLHPELFQEGVTTCVNLKEKAKLNLVFMHEGATIKSLLGYYHYPTGHKPAKEDIEATLAFPNCSFKYSGGNLSSGDQIQMKYWNGTDFEDEFPANTTVEFVLMVNAFDTDKGDVRNPLRIFYTTPEYNNYQQIKGQEQRSVALYDNQNKLVAIGFEDTFNAEDFNDVVFTVRSFPETAIDNENIPSLPDNNEEEDVNLQVYTHTGTLAFEDLWPKQGDYDMNDVITQYVSNVYITPKGITKLEDHITVKWCGGDILSGFGYQLGVRGADIKSCDITPRMSSVPVSGYGIESGQTKATIMVFDDIHKVVGKTFTITTEFTKPINKSVLVPPYNPFIVPGLGSGERGIEVHLTDNAPTDLADQSLLGTGNDLSDPGANKYYISKDNFPFAIHIPEANFRIPEEDVRIDKSYPQFAEWVISKGTESKDWYLYPDEDLTEKETSEN